MKSIPARGGNVMDEFDAERFWAHVMVDTEIRYKDDPLATATEPCWVWNGKPLPKTPQFRIRGTRMLVHRLAYIDFGGKIGPEEVIDHLCRIPSCINPDHLEPVTQGENVRRGINGNIHNCPHGHPYDGANTRIQVLKGKPVRYCRTCLTTSKHETYLRSKGS